METKTPAKFPIPGAQQENHTSLSLQSFILQTRQLSLWYSKQQALDAVTLDIPKNNITAIIGPSGCGKSTLIRSFNRMNDMVPGVRTEGEILYHQRNIQGSDVDPVEVRRRIGMVFQKPNPFPKSIYENIAFGLRINGFQGNLARHVERALQQAALWDEVKDYLHKKSGLDLSGGQQQRLCIARALAVGPEVLLMDEPCSALDPIATAKIEDLMLELKKDYTVLIVTHNMQQAARVSDFTAFLYLGQLIEFGPTKRIFENPDKRETEGYITGKFG